MKYFYLSFLLFILLSCFSTHKVVFEKFNFIHKSDTTSYNEIRFIGGSPLDTHKVMYDKFGKWSKKTYSNNIKHPILIWENIDLFSNGKKYTIITNGYEAFKYTYSSIIILDKDETDLLSESSSEKKVLANLFSRLVNKNNLKKRDFYEPYWKEVDPEKYKRIKKRG